MSNTHILGKKPYALYLSAPMYWSVFNASAPLVKRSLMQKWSDAYERVMDAGLGIDIDHTKLSELTSSRRDRKSTRLNSSHSQQSRMPSSA